MHPARLARFLPPAMFVPLGLLSLAGGIVASDRAPRPEANPLVLRAVRVVDAEGALEAIDVLIEARWEGGLHALLGLSVPTLAGGRESSVFLRAGVAGAPDYVDLVYGRAARLLTAACIAGTDQR